jgi:hypothetical protein
VDEEEEEEEEEEQRETDDDRHKKKRKKKRYGVVPFDYLAGKGNMIRTYVLLKFNTVQGITGVQA